MPEFTEYWWSELPQKAKDAATFLGWNQSTWDEDDFDSVPYYNTPLSSMSEKKKAAAFYLGWEPIYNKKFCEDLWWQDVEEETKEAASKLGFDQHKWDDDWAIHDLPVEEKYWKDLNADEQSAARYFGYTPATWNEEEDDEEASFYDGSQSNDPAPKPAKPSNAEEEKKEDDRPDEECATDEEEMTDEEEEEAAAAAAASSAAAKKKKKVKTSRVFGGADLGKKFRTGNFRRMEKLVIYADRHVVRGIEIFGGNRTMLGVKEGKTHEFPLQENEFFIKAEVRASAKSIQALTLTTNKGRIMGPCGGKGWLVGKDRAGDEFKIPAPFKYHLCGFQGSADEDHITSLAMSWGPAPARKK